MAKATSPPRPRSWAWLQGMLCGIVAVAAPGTAVTIAVLLAPGVAMFAAEQERGRPIARAMLLTGAASTFMPLRLLWEHGGSFETGLNLLSDPTRLLFSWAASGCGWITGQLTDALTRLLLDARATRQLHNLKQERETLLAEWINKK